MGQYWPLWTRNCPYERFNQIYILAVDHYNVIEQFGEKFQNVAKYANLTLSYPLDIQNWL